MRRFKSNAQVFILEGGKNIFYSEDLVEMQGLTDTEQLIVVEIVHFQATHFLKRSNPQKYSDIVLSYALSIISISRKTCVDNIMS